MVGAGVGLCSSDGTGTRGLGDVSLPADVLPETLELKPSVLRLTAIHRHVDFPVVVPPAETISEHCNRI